MRVAFIYGQVIMWPKGKTINDVVVIGEQGGGICGPMSLSSLSGYVYYFSFVGNFSRKTWIYFMKNKDDVFSKFKEFFVKLSDMNHLTR